MMMMIFNEHGIIVYRMLKAIFKRVREAKEMRRDQLALSVKGVLIPRHSPTVNCFCISVSDNGLSSLMWLGSLISIITRNVY